MLRYTCVYNCTHTICTPWCPDVDITTDKQAQRQQGLKLLARSTPRDQPESRAVRVALRGAL